jgi:hypothetical protein
MKPPISPQDPRFPKKTPLPPGGVFAFCASGVSQSGALRELEHWDVRFWDTLLIRQNADPSATASIGRIFRDSLK